MAVKTYFITGANRGLGLEFVSQLKRAGHIVIATARKPESAEELQKLVDNKQVFSLALDTVDIKSVEAAVDKVNQIAPEGIDVLINNAGVNTDRSHNSLATSGQALLDVFNTNVVGTALVSQRFIPLLKKKTDRKIFTISSILGSIASTTYAGTTAPYNVSKAAVNMYVKELSEDLKAENFTVLAIHPGWVQTDMGGAAAPLKPAESISGMLKVFNNATAKDTGSFKDYSGATLPW
ncbi:4-dihydrotrisporin dehydrogenase [Umbelopsis sp. PMI_123]|nr:4-dihydrotrisporin dehydrogenase [Umbelopsis sp. PMI_123]